MLPAADSSAKKLSLNSHSSIPENFSDKLEVLRELVAECLCGDNFF